MKEMTPAERIARAARAKVAWDEFVAPVVDEYSRNLDIIMKKVATTDLSRQAPDKIRALSHAMRVVSEVRQSMTAAILDGDLARVDQRAAENVAKMPYQQRRWAEMLGPIHG